MMKIDINSDLGESFGTYRMGNDAEMMQYITSANIACGFHAGDPMVMEHTIKLALEHGVAIGAHPGYPDLMGFGRRNMHLSPEEIKSYVLYQVSALKGMTEALGGKLQHVKAHGALYNTAVKDAQTAQAIARAVHQIDSGLILFGPAQSELIKAASEIGLPSASEVFADRAYTSEGTLVARSEKGAVIHDPELCNQRVLKMIREGLVQDINGNDIAIKVDTVCIHGDNPAAIDMARSLLYYLKNHDVTIVSITK